MKTPSPILVLGSYGRGNIGDDAFLLAALELFPDQHLCINSADDSLLPAEARGRVTTIHTDSLQDIFKKIRLFLQAHAIVYCGGDVWVELHGDRWPRQSLYRMAALNFLARLAGKRVFYIGCGIGKLNGYSRWLARCSARLARGILVREQRSAELLDLPNIQVAPDLTINLPYYQPHATPVKNKRALRIGISVLYYVPEPKRTFPRLIEHLAALIETMPETYEITLLPMLSSPQTPHNDVWASEQLRARLPNRTIAIATSHSTAECIRLLGGLDIVIAARLHANILATLSGTPCLGISYRPKVASFFRDNGLNEYCIDITELDALPEAFRTLRQHLPQAQQQFQAVSKQNLDQRSVYQAFVQQYF